MSVAAPIDTVVKAPAAALTYGIDLAVLGWLLPGETIDTVVWTIVDEAGDESPVALLDSDESNTTQALVRLTVGTDDVDYLVKAHWVLTPSGDEDERTFRIRVRNR